MTSEEQETTQRHRTSLVGMWLILAALGMLFAASLVGYIAIRSQISADIALPPLLFLSTGLIILSSATMSLALRSARAGAPSVRRWLVATFLLAIAFVIVQVPALLQLLADHQHNQSRRMHLYGLVFFLILLHALHVIGGLTALVKVTSTAVSSPTGADPGSVRLVTMYWHFLDVVWVVMFAVLLLAR